MCIVFIVMIIVFIGRCYNSYADVRFLTLDFMISIPYFINRETNKCVDWLIDSIHYTTLHYVFHQIQKKKQMRQQQTKGFFVCRKPETKTKNE